MQPFQICKALLVFSWLNASVQLTGTTLAEHEPSEHSLARYPRKCSRDTFMFFKNNIMCPVSLWLLQIFREFVVFDKLRRPILALMDSFMITSKYCHNSGVYRKYLEHIWLIGVSFLSL